MSSQGVIRFAGILLTTASLLAVTPLLTGAVHAAPSAKEKKTDGPKDVEKATKDYTILKVNGEEIPYSEVATLWKAFFGGGQVPDFESFDEKVKQSVLREVVSKRLVYAEALKEGVDKSPEFQKRMEQLRRQLVIQTFVESKTKGLMSEEKVKSAYDKKAAELANKEEVRARHILVKTEDEAKQITQQLKDGKDFAALAKDKSEDKGSGAQGGDLGFFTEDRMVPEFAKAAFKMKKGETSEPVKTDFGYHIIKVEDRRKVNVPPFDATRGQIEEEIVNAEVTKLLVGMMAKSEVSYYGSDGKTKPFVKDPKAAAAQDKPAEAAPAAGNAKPADNAKSDSTKEDSNKIHR